MVDWYYGIMVLWYYGMLIVPTLRNTKRTIIPIWHNTNLLQYHNTTIKQLSKMYFYFIFNFFYIRRIA